MEGSGFIRFQNPDNSASDQEVDLTLRIGLPRENQEAHTQGIIPQNFSNTIYNTRYHHQGMGSSGILQNAGGVERSMFSRNLNDEFPWPLPVLNMLSNNWKSISGNSGLQQQQQTCKICHKTDTPMWRKGPDGPRTLCNGCGLQYAREVKRQHY